MAPVYSDRKTVILVRAPSVYVAPEWVTSYHGEALPSASYTWSLFPMAGIP